MSKDEKVLCVPASLVESFIQDSPGFYKSADAVYLSLLDSNFQFVERSKCETDPSWKQLIPYILIRRPDGRFLSYLRGKKGGEARLHAKRSIGVGGHINDDDGNTVFAALLTGMEREMKEELGLDMTNVIGFRDFGFLYDPSDAVGLVHFGIVSILEIWDNDVSVIDEALLDPSWEPIDVLKYTEGVYENWSQIVIRELCRQEA